MDYIKKTIYLLRYEGKEEEASVSYGILKGINQVDNYTFTHLCNTINGSSGSAILNLDSYGVIWIHKEADDKNYNRGTFLNNSIQEFINNNYINKDLSIKWFKWNKKSFLNSKA